MAIVREANVSYSLRSSWLTESKNEVMLSGTEAKYLNKYIENENEYCVNGAAKFVCMPIFRMCGKKDFCSISNQS